EANMAPLGPEFDYLEQRQLNEAVREQLSVVDAGVQVEPVSAGGVPAEWLWADGATDERVVLYAHGGGFVSGSPAMAYRLAGKVSAAAAARFLLVDYRLAPEYPFPAAVDDFLAVYRWLLDGGTTASNVVFAGDSAGGGLALSAAVTVRNE